MNEIISIINQKGGVGKSTTALALASGLGYRGFKVLLADLDAQGNLSYTAGADGGGLTSFDVLSGVPVSSSVLHFNGYDLLQSDPSLATADIAFSSTGKEYKLREAFDPALHAYDYIILDTPPALGILTINALTAATSAIIPAQADIYSLQGIGQLYATLNAIKKYTNPALAVRGILLTRYNPRTILTRDMTDLLEDAAGKLGTRVFETKIRECIAVREAQAAKQDLFAYASKSNAALDYLEFIDEILL